MCARNTLALVAVLSGVSATTARADDWSSWGGDPLRTRRSLEKTGATFRAEWQHTLPGETDLQTKAIVSSPAAADGVLVFGTQRESVHALDAVTGKPLWTFQTDGFVLSSPTVHRGRVYVVAVGAIFALRATDGQVLWKKSDLRV